MSVGAVLELERGSSRVSNGLPLESYGLSLKHRKIILVPVLVECCVNRPVWLKQLEQTIGLDKTAKCLKPTFKHFAVPRNHLA